MSDDSTIRSKSGLLLDEHGNLRTRYPWEKRRKSFEDLSDAMSSMSGSSSSVSSLDKVKPIMKASLDKALENYGTIGKVDEHFTHFREYILFQFRCTKIGNHI